MMARPVLELIIFRTIKRVISTRMKPIVKVAIFGVPVIPWALDDDLAAFQPGLTEDHILG